MWFRSLVLGRTGTVFPTSDGGGFDYLAAVSFTAPTTPLVDERDLLAQIQGAVQDDALHAYTTLMVYAADFSTIAESGTAVLDLQHPLTTLTANERDRLRAVLVTWSWPAWARAPRTLRTLLGDAQEAVMASHAARTAHVKPITLLKAIERNQVPALTVGDRQMVYPATIREARARGLLQV